MKYAPVPAEHEAGEHIDIGQIRESDDESQPFPRIVDGRIPFGDLVSGQPDGGMC